MTDEKAIVKKLQDRWENRTLLESINRALDGDTVVDPEDVALLSSMRRRQRSLVNGEW